MKNELISSEAWKIDIPQIPDVRGNLSFVEEYNQIPFKIQSAYWIFDFIEGEVLEGYCLKKSCEFFIALSGSFDVVFSDGITETKYHLKKSTKGVYVPAMVWRRIEIFSPDAIALILSSSNYLIGVDYLRDFESSLSVKKNED